MTRFYFYTRLTAINILVFIALWLAIEIFNLFYNPFNKESHRITCNYDWIMYNYCPNITDVKINTDDDGGNVVYTYSNEIGQRVRDPETKLKLDVDHVFIGDSFIQAEEIDFDLTFYGRLIEMKHNVTSIGYASWNIIEYREAIKKLSIRNIHYHVFLFPNDIIPNTTRSVYGENRSNKQRKQDVQIPSGFMVDLDRAHVYSIYSKVKKAILTLLPNKTKPSQNLLSEPKEILSPINSNGFSISRIEDCLPLNQLEKEYKASIGYDYVVYSKAPNCWAKKYKTAANEALIELKKIKKLVMELNSELTVYMIPPGWTFINENTNARKNNNELFFGDTMKVTTEPLLNFFKNLLPSVKYVSLELIISKWANECGTCKNKFYFSDDGHWTQETHRRLAEYFSNTFK